MSEYTKQVITNADKLNCRATELSLSEKDRLIESIKKKYSDGSESRHFWETISERESIQDQDSWSWAGEYRPTEEVIMLFLDEQKETGVIFESGGCITKVLWECNGFEFYLTNKITSYLLVSNHHDFLIGAGEASDWIKKRKTSQ